MLVIGAGIGVLGVYYMGNNGASTTEEEVPSTPSGATTTDLAPSPAAKPAMEHAELPVPPSIPVNTRVGLSVPDQKAGNAVEVDKIETTASIWVAIYDERDGKPGWILGARRFRPGDVGGAIELLRPTQAGATYYAALLNDDGDESFNRLTDLPPMSPDKVVVVKFTTN